MVAIGNGYKILVRKPEGKRPLGRLLLRWEDNVGMDLGGIVREGVDWIRLTSGGPIKRGGGDFCTAERL
jgi:hypothetical protein